MKDNLNIIFVLALSIASVIASFIVSVISTKKNKNLGVKPSNHQENNQLILSDYTSIDDDNNTKISSKNTINFLTWNLENPIKHHTSSSRKKRKSLKRKKRHTKPWYDTLGVNFPLDLRETSSLVEKPSFPAAQRPPMSSAPMDESLGENKSLGEERIASDKSGGM